MSVRKMKTMTAMMEVATLVKLDRMRHASINEYEINSKIFFLSGHFIYLLFFGGWEGHL